MALYDQRVLLTEDKDFGQLVYANAQASNGVILIRYPANVGKTLADAVVSLIDSESTTGRSLCGAQSSLKGEMSAIQSNAFAAT